MGAVTNAHGFRKGIDLYSPRGGIPKPKCFVDCEMEGTVYIMTCICGSFYVRKTKGTFSTTCIILTFCFSYLRRSLRSYGVVTLTNTF